MTHRGGRRHFLSLFFVAAYAGCLDGPPPSDETHFVLDEQSGSSQLVTWTCTTSPCPWGNSLANPAIAWPASAQPTATRLGYTASPAPYLPADQANGVTISIAPGTASVYAGAPLADSHRLLATLSSGQSYKVTGMGSGEVLSVQSSAAFQYHVIPAPPPDPNPALTSQIVTWTCTGSPCPWGSTLTGQALAWPAHSGAIGKRLGYTVSPQIYLPAARANGSSIEILTGDVGVYAGRPQDSVHRRIASLSAGQAFDISGLASGEVLSVQSDAPFTYRVELFPPSTDPVTGGEVLQAIAASWVCNIPACSGAPWTGAVINWPDWAAYQDNARSGNQSRSVFDANGTPLYPYMGAWAEGCEVTDVSGPVLIIEWQRGRDVWRETLLQPGQSHVIHLVSPENGAMIETLDAVSAFSVSLKNCAPQALP